MKRTTSAPRRPTAAAAGPPAPRAHVGPPYSPSWFDGVKAWVERLPGPYWLPYLLLWLGLFTFETLLHWATAALPFGSWSPLHGVVTAIVPGGLCLLHALDRLAGRSFDAFRPVLHAGVTEVQTLRRQVTTLPRRTSAIVAAGSIVFGMFVFLFSPAAAERPSTPLLDSLGDLQLSPSPASLVLNVTLLAVTWAVTGTLVYHTVRQLRWVSRIYTQWTRVDLLKPGSLYSLSRISAATSLSLIVLIYLILAIDRRFMSDPRNLVGAVVFGILAVLAFVLPLLGVHRALVAEKERLLDESADRMKAALAELHRRVDEKSLRDMDALNKAIASLETERNLLNRIPTWPWQPETLRTFIGALLLPLILWLAQALLERRLPS